MTKKNGEPIINTADPFPPVEAETEAEEGSESACQPLLRYPRGEGPLERGPNHVLH
jgi:hypothetical protein